MLLVFVFNFALVDIALAEQTATEGPIKQGTANSETVVSSGTSIESIASMAMLWTLNAILTAVLALTARLMGLAGAFFDLAYGYNMNGFANVRATIDIGWGISRDIANMFFILILLIIALATILGVESYGAKTLLFRVIMVALLINFSLVFGFLIIDFTNVLSGGFYQAIIGSSGSVSGGLMRGTAINQVFDISSAASKANNGFLSWILPGIAGGAVGGCVAGTIGCFVTGTIGAILGFLGGTAGWLVWGVGSNFKDAGNYFYIVMMSNILVFPLMLVFIFGGVLLIIRFVTLTILLVIAPIAFVSYVLPATSREIWSKWWGTFLHNSFFLPVFMFLLYLSISIANGVAASLTGGGPQANPAFLTTMVIIITFIMASLVVARQMSIYGAGTVLNYAIKTRQAVAGYAGGVALRQTVGRAGEAMKSSERIQRSYYGRQFAEYMAGAGGGMKGARMTPIRKVEEDKAEAALKRSQKEWISQYGQLGTIAREAMIQKMPEKDRGRFYSDLKNADPDSYKNAMKVARVRYGAKAEEEMQKAERGNRRMQALAGGQKIGDFMDGITDSEERLAHFKDMGAKDQGELLSQWQNDAAKKDLITKDWLPKLDVEKQGQFYAEAMRRAAPAMKAEIFDGLSQDMQNKTLETMSDRDAVEMQQNASGTALTAINTAIGRTNAERQEKIEDAQAKYFTEQIRAAAVANRAAIFAARNQTEQDKILKQMSSRETLEMKQNAGAHTAAVDDAIKRLPTEKMEKVREEEARTMVKDLDRLATSWPALADDIKKAVSNTASRDELQKIAGKVADTGKFVEDVNKHAPTRASDVIAVLPGEASKVGKTAAQVIATAELDKIPEAHGKTIAKDIAENMRSKQLPKLIDRNDALTDSVLQEVQKMYDTAGKSIIKLADAFEATNNKSMANWLRTAKNPKQILGLK